MEVQVRVDDPAGGVRLEGRVGERIGMPRRQKLLVVVAVLVDGQRHLVEVILALRPLGGLANLLDGGEEQADQDGDDRNDDKQLDQREPTPPAFCEDSWHVGAPRMRKTRQYKNSLERRGGCR